MDKKTERLYFRCTKELKEELNRIAKEQNRTVSNLLEYIILKEIEKNKKGDD